jgi:MraZ protein
LSFTGEFHHTIDTKGRLIVPSRLRDELEGQKLVLTVWTDNCISLWAGDGWKRLEDKLLSLRSSSEASRRFVRQLSSQAHQDVVDKQGRISVPEHLRDRAGIKRDVVIAGALDHAELWSPEQYREEQHKVGEGGLDALIQDLEI